jgi:tetratricopeptide (TPR) repeat protein
LGDLTRAIADFGEAIRLDSVPRSFRFADRGNALRDAGQYDRALSDYATAQKLAPMDAWLLLERGRTYLRMGQMQAAKSEFDSAISLDPSNEELRRYIGVELAAAAPPPATVTPAPAPPSQTSAPRQAAAPARPPEQGKEISSGSAFVVSRQGHLLTNEHVISGCGLVEIGGIGTAMVVSRDAGNDLALIQAKTQTGAQLEPLKVRS